MSKKNNKIGMPRKRVQKEKSPRLKKDDMVQAIIKTFHTSPKTTYNYKQISKIIGAENAVQKLQVVDILHDLADDEVIVEHERGRYRCNNLGLITIGTFHRRSNGKNSFIPENGGEPIFIADQNTMHAMDGDLVKVQLFAKRKGMDPEAEVTEVIESKNKTFVGRLEIKKDFAFLITEDKTLSNDIFIPKDKLNGAQNNDKAIVRIIEWPEHAKNPFGEVVDVLGVAGQNNTEMHAILAEFGLPYTYPKEVENAALKIKEDLTPEDLETREDFRQVTTFTIDPKDAKDFDDALSLRRLPNNHWEVGVHIADVTHYVISDDIIDKEGYERATSVYLVDRTIPMLPEHISNGLCSLRPNELKRCFSAIFELDDDAEILNARIAQTLIESDRRFTYEEAQEIIEGAEGDFKDEILTLNSLAQKLRAKRFKDGSIDFDRYEVKFEIDPTGKPLSVYFKESKEANKLIEEFMLLANKHVAEFIGNPPKNKTKKTFVYRIHETPDLDKLENFSAFISCFGYKLKVNGNQREITKSINKLLNDAKGKPEENLIETLAVRSMKKARYSTVNVGHYGLSFPYYTHFTSPIRRYPDMMVHRLLKRYLAGGRSVPKETYEEMCEHCSQMEEIAAKAERSSIKYKQVEFMSDKIGKVFDGVISGVTEWGLYVELNENKCEGMVAMRNLDDDFYEFDEKNYCLRGRKRNNTYRLGDPVTIKVLHANLERKQLDFIFA